MVELGEVLVGGLIAMGLAGLALATMPEGSPCDLCGMEWDMSGCRQHCRAYQDWQKERKG